METLLRGSAGVRLDESVSSVSNLLDTEPGEKTLPRLLENAQGLTCGPAHNSLGVWRGLQLMSAGRPLEALHWLAQSHSTTLRQYMIMKSSCRLAQSEVKAGSRRDAWPAGTQEALLDSRRRLLQYKPAPDRRQEMTELIEQVPPDWTVIQLTATPRARSRLTHQNTPELVVCRFTGREPGSLLMSRVPAPPADRCCTFLSEFEAMLADNSSIQRSLSNDRQKYWTQRGLLDDRMKSILRSMEVAWLGAHAYLLCGALLRPAHKRAVCEAVSALPAALSADQRARCQLLAARLPETAQTLSAAVAAALGSEADSELRRAVTEALSSRRDLLEEAAAGARRGQVILVLDREVQRYPWETVAGLALGPACRLPSLAILAICLAARQENPPRLSSAAGGATYILNPAGDLANTEQRMGPFLEQRGWSGIVGRPPTLKEFAAALTDGQIMAYCGHGSGSQYLPSERLRSLRCSAVALLFGCSSGQLVQPGPTVDPHGSVLAYLMANCPAILGNLWSVTDHTLDTYSKAVIEDWTDGAEGRSLPEAVSSARRAVASAFMAAAPVVYGLPVTADSVMPDRSRLSRPPDRTGMEKTPGRSWLEKTPGRSWLDSVNDRSKLDATVERSRANTTQERSKFDASAAKFRANATQERSKSQASAAKLDASAARPRAVKSPADRRGRDVTADRTRVGTLTDRTNMGEAPDSSRVNPAQESEKENRAADASRTDSSQVSEVSEQSRKGAKEKPSRKDKAESSDKEAARAPTRIPTRVTDPERTQARGGKAGSETGNEGSEKPPSGARAERQEPSVTRRPRTATKTYCRPQRASRRI